MGEFSCQILNQEAEPSNFQLFQNCQKKKSSGCPPRTNTASLSAMKAAYFDLDQKVMEDSKWKGTSEVPSRFVHFRDTKIGQPTQDVSIHFLRREKGKYSGAVKTSMELLLNGRSSDDVY